MCASASRCRVGSRRPLHRRRARCRAMEVRAARSPTASSLRKEINLVGDSVLTPTRARSHRDADTQASSWRLRTTHAPCPLERAKSDKRQLRGVAGGRWVRPPREIFSRAVARRPAAYGGRLRKMVAGWLATRCRARFGGGIS